MGFSIKVAPGVRVRASSRGLRASVGPRAAGVHFGAGRPGISSGAGPVTLYHSVGGIRRKPQGGSSRTSAAARERQLRQAARSQQAAELAEAFHAIMAVHREEFPVVIAPVAPEPPPVDQNAIHKRHERQELHGIGALHRKARIAARQRAADAAAAEVAAAAAARHEQHAALQSWLDEQWRKLLANDPGVVFATLTEAFEDNEAPAAVISVESSAASVVVLCPDLSAIPERMPERTAAGNLGFKKLTKTARNSFLAELVCGRVLVTVREALAVAPALSVVRTAVVRPSAPDAYGRRRPECLLAAAFSRQALSDIQWHTASATQIVSDAATDKRIQQTAYGELRPLDLTSEPDIAQLLDAIDLDDLSEPSPDADDIPPEITSLVQQHRKIEAIKRYRALNEGMSLTEAKNAIDQIARDHARPQALSARPPMDAYPGGEIPASGVTPEIASLVQQGKKIQAIKRYRELNPGTGLKQAKDIIDQIA
jgi:ribosomal protein L7/L12